MDISLSHTLMTAPLLRRASEQMADVVIEGIKSHHIMPLAQVAVLMGKTIEEVAPIEASALAKIRTELVNRFNLNLP